MKTAMCEPKETLLVHLYQELPEETRDRIDRAVLSIVQAKQRGGLVVAVIGSGPNIHEGVTTLMAELIHKSLIDGVITSSAVVAHEMAGSLERVKRIGNHLLPVDPSILPKGGIFELTLMDETLMEEMALETPIDMALIQAAREAEGDIIIKAAGNMAYPLGLRTERIALEIESLARVSGNTFEYTAGCGADEYTMIGAGAIQAVPVVVSIPQLVGGGMVGLAIGDSISLKRRSGLIADLLSRAHVIIESGVALTQEIHDGPFETYLGHGIWSAWEGIKTYSLQHKSLVRIDLDPNLEAAWRMERNRSGVQEMIDRGLPKTKTSNIPFRMEMSGFARLENSLPVVGELGAIWPVLAYRVAEELGIELEFMSYPQETQEGVETREWIVENVIPLDLQKMKETIG